MKLKSVWLNFWISPSFSFTHNLTCHFWNGKSIYGQVCLTELRNLRLNMPCVGFWEHVGFSCSSHLRLKCCSHREYFLLKASCALITFWADSVIVEQMEIFDRLGIIWGTPPLPWACFIQYADRTTYWPNIPNLHFTSLLNNSQLHNYQFTSCHVFIPEWVEVEFVRLLKKCLYLFQYFSTSVPQHLDVLFVFTHLTVVDKVWQYHLTFYQPCSAIWFELLFLCYTIAPFDFFF